MYCIYIYIDMHIDDVYAIIRIYIYIYILYVYIYTYMYTLLCVKWKDEMWISFTGILNECSFSLP